MGGLRSVLDDSFSWKWKLRGNCGEVSCTWGNWGFHLFMHSKQIYEPRETFEILLSPKITPLSTKPFLPYYPLGISQAWTMGYKDNTWFCWIFNGLYVGLNIHRALMLILLVAYPLAWPRSLLHVLWTNRDPCCMSSDQDSILLFLYYYYYYYYFFFPSFWDFEPS